LPEPNEVHNIYNYDSDGKHYRHDVKPGICRWERGKDKREIE